MQTILLLRVAAGDEEEQVLHLGLVQHPEHLVMNRGVIISPAFSANVGGNLENIADKNQDPLNDQFVILQSLVPVLTQQSFKSLAQNSPEWFINEGFFVELAVVLDL